MFVPSVCQDYAIGKEGGWEGECGGWAGFLPFPGQWSVRCTLIPAGRLGRGSWRSAPAGNGLHSTPRCIPSGTEGRERVCQDEASALGCLQAAAAPGSWALHSQISCDHYGDHLTPQPAAPGPSGQLPSQCVCRVPPAPGPREQSPSLLELPVQRAPQCPAGGPARGGLLHDEASRAGVSGGAGRGVCRCSAGHGHFQPAGSQVRAG